MSLIKYLSRNIFVWMLGIGAAIIGVAQFLRSLGQVGSLENEAWFHHGVSETVHHLSQQKQAMVSGAVRLKTGVKGKTEAFNRLAAHDMQSVTARDADRKSVV